MLVYHRWFEEAAKIVPLLRVRRPPSRVASVLLRSAVLTSLIVLLGCGEGPTKPPEEQIPERLFYATLTATSNTCGRPTGTQFELNFFPVQNGASILGLDTQPVSATFSSDVLSFSLEVPLDDSVTVTFAASWTYASDRETFDGATTLGVSLYGSPICSHTFSTDGSVVGAISNDVPPHPGEPASEGAGVRAMVESASIWGLLEKVGETGLVRVVTPGVVNCTIADNTRRIYVPATEVTDVEGSSRAFNFANLRQVFATVFLLRWDESTEQWLKEGEFSDNLTNTVYGATYDWRTFALTDLGWRPISNMYWNLVRPGYYFITIRYLWVQPRAPGALVGDPYHLGSAWFTPGPSDYVADATVFDTPWCYYP